MKRLLVCALLCAAAFVLATPTPAEEKKAAFPDEKALMEAMVKAGTPGENHKKLEPLAGSWEFAIKMWIDPSKPPMESKGTAEYKWIFGGRYLEQMIKGEFGGQPFEGRGLYGYDNLQKKFVSSWIDSMSTGIATSTGSVSSDGKTFTFSGEEICPLTDEKLKVRSVLKIISKDKHEAEYFQTRAGQEHKGMHIVYTRTK